MLVSIGILTACGGSDKQASELSTANESEESSVDNEPEITEQENSTNEEENNEDISSEQDKEDNQDEKNSAEDQMNLEIGDTAIIESTIGMYKVTLNNVQFKEEIEGESSQLEAYLLVEYTLENVGEESIEVWESMRTVEATDWLEGSGQSDVSGQFDSLESFEDNILDPGEKAKGEVLYNIYDADEFYVRAHQGLIASGGLKNDILFTFQKSEIE